MYTTLDILNKTIFQTDPGPRESKWKEFVSVCQMIDDETGVKDSLLKSETLCVLPHDTLDMAAFDKDGNQKWFLKGPNEHGFSVFFTRQCEQPLQRTRQRTMQQMPVTDPTYTEKKQGENEFFPHVFDGKTLQDGSVVGKVTHYLLDNKNRFAAFVTIVTSKTSVWPTVPHPLLGQETFLYINLICADKTAQGKTFAHIMSAIRNLCTANAITHILLSSLPHVISLYYNKIGARFISRDGVEKDPEEIQKLMKEKPSRWPEPPLTEAGSEKGFAHMKRMCKKEETYLEMTAKKTNP